MHRNKFLSEFVNRHKGGMIESIKKEYNRSPHLGKLVDIARNLEPPKDLRDSLREMGHPMHNMMRKQSSVGR